MKGKFKLIKAYVMGFISATIILGMMMTSVADPVLRNINVALGGIKIYVDGVEQKPVNAKGQVVEPLIYDGTTYLPVRALTNMLTTKEVNWDGNTKSVYIGKKPEISKPEKNGFNEKTNKLFTFNNYNMSLPSYWDDKSEKEDNILFYAETSGKVAMLQIGKIAKTYFDFTPENVEKAKDAIFMSILDGLNAEYSDINSQFYETSFVKGYLFSCKLNIKGYPSKMKIFAFISSSDDTITSIGIIETDNTRFTYNNDFKKIIDSIKHLNDYDYNNSNNNTSNKKTDLISGIRPEFKAAMDSYEAFYDEYVAFLKRYFDRPLGLDLTDEYENMETKQADMDRKFELWRDFDLNYMELTYYLGVADRTVKKLERLLNQYKN